MSRSASPAWVVAPASRARSTRPPVTAASARNGAALDRSGSMRWSTGFTDAGRDRPAVGLGVVDLDAVLAQHRDGHVDVGQRGHRLAVVADVDARRRSARRPAAAPRRTARTPRRRSRRVPPRTEPVPRTLERQRAAAAVLDRRRRGRAGRPSTSPIGRVRMCGSPSKATGADGQRRPPAARTASRCPASPQSTCASRSKAARASPPSRRRRCRRAEPSPVSAAAISRVSRDRSARRTTLGPVGQRGEHQGPVGQRLAAGQRDDGVDRAGRPWVRARAATPTPASQVTLALASAASRRAARGEVPGLAAGVLGDAAGAPGDARLPLGVAGGDHQPAEHRDVLEEVDALLGRARPGRAPPRTGGRPPWSAPASPPARRPRGAAPGRWPAPAPATTWTPPLSRTSVTGSDGSCGTTRCSSGTSRSVTGAAVSAFVAALRTESSPPTTNIEASIGRASSLLMAMAQSIPTLQADGHAHGVPVHCGAIGPVG